MARWSWEADAARTERGRAQRGSIWSGRGLPLYPRVAYYWRRYESLADCARRWSVDLPIEPARNCGVYALPNDEEPQLIIVVGLTGGVTAMYVHEQQLRTFWSASWVDFRTERRLMAFPVPIPDSVPSPGSFNFQRYYERVKQKGPASTQKFRIELRDKAKKIQAASSGKSPASLDTIRLNLKAIDAELSLLDWLIEASFILRKHEKGPNLARLLSVGPRAGEELENEIEKAVTTVEETRDPTATSLVVHDETFKRYLLRERKSLFVPLEVAYSTPAHFFNKVVATVDPEFLDREVEDVLWTWGCGALLNRRVSDKWLGARVTVHQAVIELFERRGSYEDGRHPTDAGVTDKTKAIADEADVVWKMLGRLSGYSGDTVAEQKIYELHREPIEAFRREGSKRGRREAADEIVGKFYRLSGGAVKKGRQRRNKDAKPRVVPDPAKKT